MSRVEKAELGAFATDRPRWAALRFVASTGEPVRQSGQDRPVKVLADGLDLSVFRRNPVCLWRHKDDRFPIGRANAWRDGHRLLVDVRFDRLDRLARQVELRYRRGFLSAVSICYEPLDWAFDDTESVCIVTKSILLEVSCVVLPADRGAVRQPAPSRFRSFTDVAAGFLGPGSPAAVGSLFRRRGGNPTAPSSPREVLGV